VVLPEAGDRDYFPVDKGEFVCQVFDSGAIFVCSNDQFDTILPEINLISAEVFPEYVHARIRVPLGFIFAAVFVVFARPNVLTLSVGSGIAVVGLLIRAWASGHIRKAEQLAVSGPYGFTRNPLYLGSFVLGVGFTVAAGVWWLALVFCALFIGIYLPVMRVEAEDMRNIFGGGFDGKPR